MSESILLQDCPELVQDYKDKFYDPSTGLWKDHVGIKNAKNNPSASRGRGSTRGRGRPRGRPRGRARGGSKFGRGPSDLVKPAKVKPVGPTRRSSRHRMVADLKTMSVSVIEISDTNTPEYFKSRVEDSLRRDNLLIDSPSQSGSKD